MSSKKDPNYRINNPDIGVGSAPGLKGKPPLPKQLPKSKPKKPKETYAAGGKKIKMASYYSGGGTVFTGR